MKKIIFAITALLTTMIMIAQPLYVHAADVISVHEYQEINEIGSEELPANIQSRLAGLQYMLNSNSYEENGIVKKCAVIEYPKSEIGIYQAA